MKRILLMALKSVFQLPLWLILLNKYKKHPEKYDEKTRYSFLSHLTRIVNKRGGIRITCTGTENLPKENGYVLYGNHQGLFDALLLLETHEKPFATISKIEIKNIPFLRDVFTLLGSKFIVREDVRQSLTVLNEVTAEVKQGRNYLIFPEGTRSKMGNQIQEFKGGSFKCAMNAKSPIVPLAILNSYKVFDTSSIKKVDVQIHYLKPLYYEDYKGMKSNDIARYVEEAIRLKIAEAEMNA
ncbi:lysophospholipid acyltransferase family protein [Anaerocolumna xylanovorans]|uniref:1-acyl-sn-glycerol-3-phosphate acyltransferase n=1 Tax=Anaerocolumna xylanovorans DSM 12503 TaxID=1121345 RepID=A0A1M7Y735_9FIRM|nr:lysophospholipid acyltransferase family protein [Anaerocolumna xylanovorans]SHO48453.1 1-acyl-sn-glycerol-3-phosphate acyltransferase [Anaerocolumna xylanovorans DSM 12503]